ncbi:thermonuclease family protein [Amphiplicatus metriothermophilus]
MIAASGLPRIATADERIEGTVVRIVDGDTFYLSGVDARIRLWGVDAPERGAPGGAEATRALAEIAADRRISCKHVDTDRYGRIVGQCFLPSGEDVAALMIGRGAAREHFRYSSGYYSVHSLITRTER